MTNMHPATACYHLTFNQAMSSLIQLKLDYHHLPASLSKERVRGAEEEIYLSFLYLSGMDKKL